MTDWKKQAEDLLNPILTPELCASWARASAIEAVAAALAGAGSEPTREDAEALARSLITILDITEREAIDEIVRTMKAVAAAQKEKDATIALEQRCERGTPWDLACTTIAAAIRSAPL